MNKKQIETYILDTTILIEDPEAFYKNGKVNWVIPLVVVRELDGLKNSEKERVAQPAREVARTLDRLSSYADLADGVKLSTGSILRVYADYEIVDALASDADNKILGAALSLKKAGEKVKLFTTDTNMRIAARMLGIKAEYMPTYDIDMDWQKKVETERAEIRRGNYNTNKSQQIVTKSNETENKVKNVIVKQTPVYFKTDFFFFGLLTLSAFWTDLLVYAVIFCSFYFFLIRPSWKKQRIKKHQVSTYEGFDNATFTTPPYNGGGYNRINSGYSTFED